MEGCWEMLSSSSRSSFCPHGPFLSALRRFFFVHVRVLRQPWLHHTRPPLTRAGCGFGHARGLPQVIHQGIGLEGPCAITMKMAESTQASSRPSMRRVPTGMWRLFQDKRTASLWSVRGRFGGLSGMMLSTDPGTRSRHLLLRGGTIR